MKRGSKRPWSRTHWAFVGAFLGMGLAMAHQVHHAVVGKVLDENPIAHIFPEVVGLTAGGALLLAVIAEACNRLGL